MRPASTSICFAHLRRHLRGKEFYRCGAPCRAHAGCREPAGCGALKPGGRPLFFRGASAVTQTERGEPARVIRRVRRRPGQGSVRPQLARRHRRQRPADDYAPRVLPFLSDSERSLLPYVTVDLVLAESKAHARQVAAGSADLALITDGETRSAEARSCSGTASSGRRRTAATSNARPCASAVWNDDDSSARAMFDSFRKTGRPYCIAVVSQSAPDCALPWLRATRSRRWKRRTGSAACANWPDRTVFGPCRAIRSGRSGAGCENRRRSTGSRPVWSSNSPDTTFSCDSQRCVPTCSSRAGKGVISPRYPHGDTQHVGVTKVTQTNP